MKDILEKLYKYQLESVKATDKNDKGIVIMPTGAGKTFVEAAVIAKDIQKNLGEFGVYVINAPRIMLSYQLLKEVYSFLTYAGIDARYMSVHSGGSVDIKDLETIRIDANGNEVVPVMTENADPVCVGDKIYTFTYTDCADNTADWIYTYNVKDDVSSQAYYSMAYLQNSDAILEAVTATQDSILIDTTNLSIKSCFIKIRNIIDKGLKKK